MLLLIPRDAIAWRPLGLLERLAWEALNPGAEQKLWIARFVFGQPAWSAWSDGEKFAMVLAAVRHLLPALQDPESMAHEIRRDLGIKYRPVWTQGRDPDPNRAKPWSPA